MNDQIQERLFKMTALEACNDLYLKSVKPLLSKKDLPKGFARKLSVAYVVLKCEAHYHDKGIFNSNRVPKEKLEERYRSVTTLIREVLKDGTNKGTIDRGIEESPSNV